MEGAKVYVQHGGGWQKAVVLAALGDGRFRVQLEAWEDACGRHGAATSEQIEVDASSFEGKALPFQNANMPQTGFPNMTTLDHLHEAAILHNLRTRFFAGACPYTYTADIVIAINPYKWFPDLYTDERRKEYFVFDRSRLAPHVYSTSSAAFFGLKETKVDQAILVSGESGAGKTETVKILMSHLALIASSDDSSHIRRIVESNPLLESFGNAQTVRNDNSSRFGKFIELELSGACQLLGSRCRTYLLEKSRVVGQDAGERNYHIFYQMLAVDDSTRASFGLGGDNRTRDTMLYTRQGQSKTDTIEGRSDAQRFQDTVGALALVGVEGSSLTGLLKALAGVLLLGQLEFGGGKSAEDPATLSGDAGADIAAALEVDVDAFGRALTRKTIRAANEVVIKPLSRDEAAQTRDALAKELYARTFDWLVERICAATAAPAGNAEHFVGLLDIFGFESFAINRFEQLCINYANEKLQQKFTMDVFKAVQQEYSEEGIPWDRIEFKDNAPVLALIEAKLGVIAMLNEECVRPRGTDQNFVSKLTTVHKEDPAFSTPKLGKQKELQFTIKHYAGAVTYTSSGWLERNKDATSEDILQLMRSSANSLVSLVFAEQAAMAGAAEPGRKAGADTVATKFRTSLAQLMDTVGKTQTQYVRCIKPNKKKSPVDVDNEMVLEQLRCAGVIEAIRISRAGFPARMPLQDFACRFALLGQALSGVGFSGRRHRKESGGVISGDRGAAVAAMAAISAGKDWQAACRSLMAALLPGEKQQYEIGRTRVYFKHGILESLEEKRSLLLQAAATEITRRARGMLLESRYQRLRRASLCLQATQRMRGDRSRFQATRTAAILCQSQRRALLARRRFAALRRERAATRIQAFARCFAEVRELRRKRRAATRVQAAARRRICRRRYKAALAEHKEQAKLENQVRALQAKLEAQERQAKLHAEEMAAAAAAAAANSSRPEPSLPSRAPAPAPAEPPPPSEPSAEILEALQALAQENTKLKMQLEQQRTEIAELRRENKQLREDASTRGHLLASFRREKKSQPAAERRESRLSPDSAHEGPVSKKGSKQQSPEAVSFPEARRDTVDSSSMVTHSGAGIPMFDDNSSEATVPSVRRNVSQMQIRLCRPLFEYWEDVPSSVLPMLKSGAEVHIKFGANILMVDDGGKYLHWKPWMTSANGYRRSMAFFIERTPPTGAAEAEVDDGRLGSTFTLRSALNGKYVIVGGLLEQHCMRISGHKPDEAAAFTAVPFEDAAPFACLDLGSREEETLAAHYFAIRLLGGEKTRVLSLRKDGYVAMKTVSNFDTDVMSDKMAAAMEFLAPCGTYNLTIHDEQIGIDVGKDPKEMPLRVAGFQQVPNGGGGSGPGLAERSGRVHIGDVITAVNGQDITGLSRSEALAAIASRRPVNLAFSLARTATQKVSTPGSTFSPSPLRYFGKRSTEKAQRI